MSVKETQAKYVAWETGDTVDMEAFGEGWEAGAAWAQEQIAAWLHDAAPLSELMEAGFDDNDIDDIDKERAGRIRDGDWKK